VKHGDEFAGGELIRMGKEAAGKHLQCQVPRFGREVEAIKENRCALTVIAAERGREVDVEQLEGGRDVDSSKITNLK